jgi:hypothetical protein
MRRLMGGTIGRRRAMKFRIASKEYPPGTVDGSRTMAAIT